MRGASPEMVLANPVDARTDVYSLGVVLYELLSGSRRYRLKSAVSSGVLDEAISAVRIDKPSTQIHLQSCAARATTPEQLARQLRGDLHAIVLKALAKHPRERYRSVSGFSADLHRYLNGEAVSAQPARMAYPARKWLRRNRMPMFLALSLAVSRACLD